MARLAGVAVARPEGLTDQVKETASFQLGKLKNVSFSGFTDHSQIVLHLETIKQIKYNSSWTSYPARLYLDLSDITIGGQVRNRDIVVRDQFLKRIRIGQRQPTMTRVVIDFASASPPRVSLLNNPPRLVVELQNSPTEESIETVISHSKLPPEVKEPPKPEVAPGKPLPEDVPKALPDSTKNAAMVVTALPASIAVPSDAGLARPVGNATVLRIPRVSGPPKLEDFLNGNPRGAEARIADFRQRQPGDGTPVSQETVAYLSYDDKNLYVVFVCKDERQKISAHMAKREEISSDDQVAVYLDTFHDYRRAFVFKANPRGVQLDGIINEAERKEDYSFDTVWHTTGRLTGNGFVVWMAIPFKSLRYSGASQQTWGIALSRSIFRSNEVSYWPYITNRVSGFVQQLASLEGLENISHGQSVQLIPYGTFTRARLPDTTGSGFRRTEDRQGGLDTKIVLRNALTFDGTFNPDFSQVESDEPQVIINNRFEAYFPEKRPFFLENSDFFATPQNLFFSRRIADPEFGARLTGKIGGWALGALAAQDRIATADPQDPSLPLYGRANVAVASLRRDLGKGSNIGLLTTSRDLGPTWNRVFSLDARIKLSPSWSLNGQIIRSYTRQQDGQRLSGPGYFAELSRGGRHFTYVGRYTDYSPDFRSQLGFIPRVDIRQTDQFATYRWYPQGKSVLSYGPAGFAFVNWDRQGRVQDWFVNSEFAIEFRHQTQLKLSRIEAYEFYQQMGFRKNRTEVSIFTAPRRWLSLFSHFGEGTNINYAPLSPLRPFLANAMDGSLTITLRPSSRFRFDQTGIYSRLSTFKGFSPVQNSSSAGIFSNQILRSKLNYQFTRTLSLRTILDYYGLTPNSSLIAQTRLRKLSGDILLTYQVNPSTGFYVGYTDRYDILAIDSTQPNFWRRWTEAISATQRQFFVKVNYQVRF
jgi:hypothetical protein